MASEKCIKARKPAEVLKSLIIKVERLGAELATLDERLLESLLEEDSETYNCEYGYVDSYRDTLDSVRASIYKMMHSTDSEKLASSCNNIKKLLKLPEIELVRLGGVLGSIYRIHEDDDIEDADKFQYLIQSTKVGSCARELVNSFSPIGDNYNKAIDTLTSRFGRYDLLIEYYIREFIKSSNRKEKCNLAVLYDKLEIWLESINVTRDKYGSMLIPLVESCLPEKVLHAWLRNSVYNKRTTY
ncbi:hypothetical protein PR048_028986 [Dryococelus australis]|uniref:Uncharacterized protein n=1 Tax=Dryococelus australis TaxID=614101 RepID=A0ABQ9GC41_9NEOP|nr:hypothetical protein PR048_028986 [Dryococelus australis]